MSITNDIAAEIIKRPAQDWLTEQYLPYTLYVIRDRALVAEDGLKPVQRRILYSLFKDGVHPTARYLKAARAAANTVAYHPHGNASIEDTLAGLAQGFKMRVPLIDAAGSIGKVTGDRASAARYWDCRLSKAAMELLKELPMGAMPIAKNYDGELDEARLLPIRWPSNIINGTEGIAVAYASKMFSHNPDETMKAALAVLKNNDISIDEILKIMPGPDLPTGGELLEVDGVREYYETGKGGFTIRGRYNIEHLSRGRVRIIFYELPFQVAPEKVIAAIGAAQATGKFGDVASVKELSDRKNGLRLVIDTKAGSNHLNVLSEVFKNTPAEQRFSVNNTVLVDNTPTQVSMVDMLRAFVDFRRTCVFNKTETRQSKIDKRLYQLHAILAALIDIDKCIRIIRGSDSAEIARDELMSAFKVDEGQAEYILSMQLRRLTKADAVALNQEIADLEAEKKRNEETLNTPSMIDVIVAEEIAETMAIISNPRRTVISGLTSADVKATAAKAAKAAKESTKNSPCYVTRFADGTLLRTEEPFEYPRGTKKFDHSPIIEQIQTRTQESLLVVLSDGNANRIPVSYLAQDQPSSVNTIGIKGDERVVAIGRYKPLKGDVGVALATKMGDVKITKPEHPNKDEFTIFSLAEGDEIVEGFWIGRQLEGTNFVSVSSQGNILAYDASKVRPTGVGAGGMKSQKLLGETDRIVGFAWVEQTPEVPLFVLSKGDLTMKVTPLAEIPPKGRGAQGVALHKMKRGESELLDASITVAPAISVKSMNNAVIVPPVSKRATTGVDFGMEICLGAMKVRVV